MGGNSPSHFANGGDGEAGGVSFVKGIRLSDRVVHRMKETPKVVRPRPPMRSEPEPVAPVPAPSAEHVSTAPESPVIPLIPTLPVREPTPASTPPSAQPVKLIPPPPVKFHSPPPPPVVPQEPNTATVTDPVALMTPVPSPVPEPEATSTPLPQPETALPTPAAIEGGQSVVSQTPDSGPPPPADPPRPCHSMEVALPTTGSAAAEPVDLDPPTSAPLDAEPQVESSTSLPVAEDPLPVFILRPLPVSDGPVDEEELRRKIKEELQERLGEELHQKKQELQLQLEQVKARARAEARAAAQVEIQAQVKQTLEAERADYVEKLRNALLTERMKSEDERLIAQLYRAQFYKVSAENFQKGKEETHSRFARFTISPACGDLQSRVMSCYRDNAGKTLACSSIAAAYMQCVADAKQQVSPSSMFPLPTPTAPEVLLRNPHTEKQPHVNDRTPLDEGKGEKDLNVNLSRRA
ncbi:unnamed protein product [Merluccius merluccius]